MQSEPVTDADRMMVTDLFKEIAAYGRRVRERRAVETARDEKTPCDNFQLAAEESPKPV